MHVRRIVTATAALAAALALQGCAARRAAEVTYHDPDMDFGLIQHIAVMPFENLAGNRTAGDAVREVFMTMMQATGAAYVLPPGEVGRGISRLALKSPATPTAEEAVQLANIVGADVVITGTVLEYGELRTSGSAANVVSIGVRMLEGQTGKVVWSASASRGGVSAADRFFGGGGRPMDEVTREAVARLLDQLFKP